MGNLNRSINKYLLNTVASGTTDVETIADPVTARPVFMHKSLGINFIGNVASEAHPPLAVNVKPGSAGTKQVSTLELVRLYNPNQLSYEFSITIVKKAGWNGFSDEVFDRPRTYNYVKTNFTTASAGAFDATDTTDILNTLRDRINADVALGDAQVSTGACVVATVVAASSPTPAYLVLTSKDEEDVFEVLVDTDDFDLDEQGSPVAGVKPKGKWDAIARIFPVRADQAGTLVTTPVVGTYYTEIEITQRTEGYDNVVATGYNTKEQKTLIYVPNASADALADPIVAQLLLAALAITKDGVAWT